MSLETFDVRIEYSLMQLREGKDTSAAYVGIPLHCRCSSACMHAYACPCTRAQHRFFYQGGSARVQCPYGNSTIPQPEISFV